MPHPKTLTAAGELEYFAARVRSPTETMTQTAFSLPLLTPIPAKTQRRHGFGDPVGTLAQGHHPFAFALAELVDNSLRATRTHTTRERNIRVSLVLHPDKDEGLVSVSMRMSFACRSICSDDLPAHSSLIPIVSVNPSILV